MSDTTFNRIAIVAVIIYAVSVSERLMYNRKSTTENVKYEQEKRQHEQKINNYENEIFKDSVIVWNSDRNKRDSLRSIYNPSR